MSYTVPHSKPISISLLPNEEQFVFVPGDNLGLPAASAGSSTLEANRVYHQPEIEARFPLLQTALQHNFPPHEPITIDSYNYIPPLRTAGHFTTQSFTESHKKRTVGRRARPVCAFCNKDFGRVQELNRHLREKHMPRRRCPFCDFRRARPDAIKAHLIACHANKFTADMLEEVKALRGQHFIEFVDAYDHGLDLEHGSYIGVTSSIPLSASQL